MNQLPLFGKGEPFRLEPSPNEIKIIRCIVCGEDRQLIKRSRREVVTIWLRCKCKAVRGKA